MFLQISKVSLEIAVIYYGGHLVISNQMSSAQLISFFIYVLDLADSLEVSDVCSSASESKQNLLLTCAPSSRLLHPCTRG